MSNKKKMEVLYFVEQYIKMVWISAYCAGYRKRV